MKYNPEIHHRRTIRLKEYDYSTAGYYFVTICTINRVHLFGEIINEKIELNAFGKITDDCVKDIPLHFPNDMVDSYCIMPNHIHLIIIIDDCRDTACRVPTGKNIPAGRDTACRVPTESFGKPVSGSLPTIIRSLKSAITNRINIIRDSPGIPVWQRNYYEHIIRNDKDLHAIRNYIENNAINWNDDEYNA